MLGLDFRAVLEVALCTTHVNLGPRCCTTIWGRHALTVAQIGDASLECRGHVTIGNVADDLVTNSLPHAELQIWMVHNGAQARSLTLTIHEHPVLATGELDPDLVDAAIVDSRPACDNAHPTNVEAHLAIAKEEHLALPSTATVLPQALVECLCEDRACRMLGLDFRSELEVALRATHVSLGHGCFTTNWGTITLLGLASEWVNSEELIGALEGSTHFLPCSPFAPIRTAVAHPHPTIAHSRPLQVALRHGRMPWVFAGDTGRTDALLCLAICWILAEELVAAGEGSCDRLPIGPPSIVAHLHLSCANALLAHGAGLHCRVVWVLARHPTWGANSLLLGDTAEIDLLAHPFDGERLHQHECRTTREHACEARTIEP